MSKKSLELNAQPKLEALRVAYQSRLHEELDQVRGLVNSLQVDPGDVKTLKTLQTKLHKLAGSAGTFGFNFVGRQARRIEVLITELLDQSASGAGEQPLFEWLGYLDKALAEDVAKSSVQAIESYPSVSDSDLVIWLLERDPILANYIAQQLTSFGFQVNRFDDVDELPPCLSDDGAAPALILIDHRASKSPELEIDPATFWKSRLSGYGCPIIFTGAEESFEVRLNAVRSGAVGYFTKPIDAPRIASTITRLLRSSYEHPERVLIVEDDETVALHCMLALENAGMSARWLNQPNELIRVMGDFSPEIILMDLRLPEVSGIELVKILAQFNRWSEIPIVYLSAEANENIRAKALMEGGDAFLEKPVSAELLVSTCRSRVRRLRQLQQAITRDGLTGLIKHSAIKNALQVELDYANRHKTTFSVIMLDIDHFKSVNDDYGHAVGDLVIAAVGTLLRQHFRKTDKLGRYGGEEFALVLPNCTAQTAVQLVNGMRAAFFSIQFLGNGEKFSCTLSAGVIDNQKYASCSAEQLIENADKFLYEAKRSGRNRVCTDDA